jgi:hypothetical protein
LLPGARQLIVRLLFGWRLLVGEQGASLFRGEREPKPFTVMGMAWFPPFLQDGSRPPPLVQSFCSRIDFRKDHEMTSSLSIKKKPRRWRRWLLAIALGLFGLVVSGCASVWWRLVWEQSQGREELAAVIAETDEKDPRWRWEAIEEDRAPISDAENSMLVMKKLTDSFGKWQPTELKLPDGQPVYNSDYPSNRRLDEQHLMLIRKELGKREQSVALAVSLQNYPRGRASFELTTDMLSTLLPHVQPVRDVARLLALDVERLVHGTPTDRAADRIRAMLRAAAGLRDDPFLISLLVRMACRKVAVDSTERLLGMSELSDEACRTLSIQFAEELPAADLLASLRGERALYHRLFENLEHGQLTVGEFFARSEGNSNSKPDVSLRLGGFLYSYRLPEDHATLLRWFDEACDIARLPSQEQLEAWNLFELKIRAVRSTASPDKRLILSTLLLPAVKKVGQATLRDQVLVVCAETALATERFRLAHKRWPKSLDELRPAFLAQLPRDPYTGESLRYARRDDGVVIYSVGPDLQDDGGDILRYRPQGNYDIGLRLFDPDKRNLPPLAEPVRQ